MNLAKPNNAIDRNMFRFGEGNQSLVPKIRLPATVTPSANFVGETRRRLLRLGHRKESSRRRAA